MFLKAYWFRELYLGLKVTASFDRSESYTRIIDGQVRCITPDFKPKDLQVAWNVQFITVFFSAWMVPPIYHSLRRESIKNMNSASAIGVKSVRPTWFEDIVTAKEPASQAEQEPMHGLKVEAAAFFRCKRLFFLPHSFFCLKHAFFSPHVFFPHRGSFFSPQVFFMFPKQCVCLSNLTDGL